MLAALALLASAFGLTGCGGSPLDRAVGPSWSPDGTKVAFTSRSAVYVADADGAHAHRLASGWAPVWAPDGRHIAFLRGDVAELYVMDAKGSDVHQVTASSGGHGYVELRPSWSPDGRRIIYTTVSDCFQLLWESHCGIDTSIVEVEDGNPRLFSGPGCVKTESAWTPPHTGCAYAAWGPTGLIAFVLTGDKFHGGPLFVTDLRGSFLRKVADDAGCPAWSPDGKRIAFINTAGRQLQVVDAAARTKPRTLHGGVNDNPAWSPDGKQIIFDSSPNDRYRPKLYVIHPDGTHLHAFGVSR